MASQFNIKPEQWVFDPSQVGSDWGWFWESATAVVPFWESLTGTRIAPINLVTDKALIATGVPAWGTGTQGTFVEFTDTTHEYILGNEADIAPRGTHGSYFLIRRKIDLTARTAANFGVSDSGANRLSLSVPFEADFAFDWGNASGTGRAGTNSLSTTTNIELWACTAGPLFGVKLYLNGIEVASNNGTAATRTAGSDDFFINDGVADVSGDLAEYLFFAAFDAELTPAQVAQWADDPYGPITQESGFSAWNPVGGVTFEVNLATAFEFDAVNTVLAEFETNLSVDSQHDVVESVLAEFETSLSVDSQHDVVESVLAEFETNLTVDSQHDAIHSVLAEFETSLPVDSQHDVIESVLAEFETSLSIASQHDVAESVVAVFEGNISVDSQHDVAENVAAEFDVNISVDTTLATQFNALLEFDVSLPVSFTKSVGYTVNVEFDLNLLTAVELDAVVTAVSAILTKPDGRVLTVAPDNRRIIIEEDSRRIIIKFENRRLKEE